ncbi:ATP-binding protein [Alkalihalobacterium elongatum]|uniref:ATP-binding protein n=1 Tax=Alkalihalobacterium elongatum TaxID=2675466 RepID=UPI001C1F23A1|nr:ATP-binding protein [Alkalihalobacterium elongatum]
MNALIRLFKSKPYYKIPLLYIALGLIWILSTDLVLTYMEQYNNLNTIWRTFKGWFFIIFSGILFFILFKNQYKMQQVEEEREMLSSFINAMSDFISIKDGENRWLELNDFAYKLYDLNEEDYSGKNDAELSQLYPSYRDHFLECVRTDEEAWTKGKPIQFEEILQLEEGERIFQVIKVPLFTKEGKRKALFVIGRDITDIKKAEDLIAKNEKLSVVGQLAAGVAHEIRNPLTSLKGFVKLIQENKGDNNFYLGIMDKELERINIIVNELLLIAKPQKEAFTKNNIVSLLRSVIDLMTSEAKMSGVKLEIHAENNLPLIDCEAYHLKQVFINIIKNAIEASKEGDVITVRIFNEKDKICVQVIDKGCGIEKERLQKIGEPFFTMKEKGTGLGMTVSYKIIQNHNGSLHIDSELGKGTSVTVQLPIENKQKT